jgi:DNA replication and repair protein RecF
MYLTHLSLTNFRNFARLDLDVPKGAIMVVGNNAQGKTSLLEAIFFLSSMVSFHVTSDRQLINFIAAREPLSVARIVAEYKKNHKAVRLEARIIQEANETNGAPRLRKEIYLNGVKQKIGDAVGNFKAVLFLPQMLEVIEGSPEERRKYINLTLSQTVSHYANSLADYSRALSQRNALLKMLSERGGDASQLEYWDEQLSIAGALLIQARIDAIRDFNRLAAHIYTELCEGLDVLRIDYLPSFDPLVRPEKQFTLPVDTFIDRSGLSLDFIQTSFLACLVDLRREEISRGITTIGPHRDDIRFLSNGIDLSNYGSRGQVRTAMLAIKLAEVAWMKEKSDDWPVLLLDEVLAELDAQRRVDLLARLEVCEQSLLTTTDLHLFSNAFIQNATVWQVEGGRVYLNHAARGI